MNRTVLVLGLSVALLSTSSIAQELEEVVVTARKTEENLQDVPIAVTAFTAEQITERGLNDVFDISNFTPGFAFEKLNRYGVQGGGSRPVIRGQSQILGEANASVFIDGLQYNDSILSFPFEIIERVEVIKGPQAALFGRATFAGAINLITKRGTNEFENVISTRIGDFGEFQGNFFSRGPLVEDKVFYTANVRYYTFDGFYRNSLDNERIGDEESINFDGSLEFRPNDDFRARFSIGYGEDDDGAAALTLQDRSFNNCFLNVARQYYCGEVVRTPPTEQNLELFGNDIGLDKDNLRLAAQFEYDFGGVTLASNTGYFDADQNYGYDVDLTANATTFGGTFNRIAVSNREEWSTELMLRSNSEGPLGWMVGGYYYQSRRDFREDRLNGSTVDQGEARIDNIAFFGSLSYQFTEQLSGSVELRYAEDEIGNFNPVARPTMPKFETTYESWSPRFTLDYQINENSMVYASFAQGNKPGFINANPLLTEEFLFADEEESDNWEIGTKNVLADGRFIVNLAAYSIDWKQQQLTTITFLTDGRPASVVVNAGKTKVEGLELEMTGALTENFTAGLGYALTDARFREFDDAEAAVFFGDPSVRGNQTPNSSKHQLNLFSRYDFPVRGNINGFVRADYSYASKKYAQVFNLAHSGDLNLLNLKAGLESDNWAVTLFVDNVTDNRTPSTVIRFVDFENFLPTGDSMRTSGFVRAFQYPQPDKRQWGVIASYRF